MQNFDPDYPEPSMFPFEIKKITKDEKGKPVYEWDFTRFNPAYFAHVEACVDNLAGIGVEADLILSTLMMVAVGDLTGCLWKPVSDI